MNTPATPKPNSRNPWPIAIVAYFVLFISFIIGYIIWSTGQRQDLVRSDYYEQEIKFQQRLDSMNRTQPLRAQVAVTFDPATRAVRIALPVENGKPSIGEIDLYRPSDSRLDKKFQLALDAQGIQHLDAAKLRPGRWKVRVQWTVDGRDYFFDQALVII